MNVESSNPFAALGLARAPEKADTRELGQADFLRLMLAQVQNQNPLEPQANGEFLGQLAQFGIVDGVQQLNSGFGDLSDRLAGEQTLAAASLLGREVLVAGDTRATGTGLSGVVQGASGSDPVNVEIVDGSGQTVRRISLDAGTNGDTPFVWDGRDDKGNALPYGSYSVVATTGSGRNSVQLDTLLAAPVTAVSRQGANVTLDLDGLPSAAISDIRRIN